MTYDLAIIGGGPGGYVAAERAAKGGMSVVLFEKNALGGVCLNEGCIPTKTLLYCAKMYEHAAHGEKFGVKAEGVSFDFDKIMDRKVRTVRRLVGGIKAKMRGAGVEVVSGEAFINGRVAVDDAPAGSPCGDGQAFGIRCNDTGYTAARLLICTGSSCAVPPIPGLREAGDVIVTNREILSLSEVPSSLVIIGGGVIGMEFASFFNTLGTEVTIIEMLPEILGGLDREISAMLRGQYARKGVKFHLGCRVTAIEGNTVVYEDPEAGTQRVSGDKVLLSVGRRANVTGFGLENLGVEVQRGIKVDEHLRTSVPGVWAAGDVTGFSLLAHTASREGEVAVADMLGKDEVMSYKAIPGIVYTNPEVAGVGLTQEQAPEAEILKLPMNFSGRYMAENDCDGICKVLLDKESRKVLGVHMLGNPCSEIIHSAGIAVEKGMTADELCSVVFPHPTVSEIFKETLGQ